MGAALGKQGVAKPSAKQDHSKANGVLDSVDFSRENKTASTIANQEAIVTAHLAVYESIEAKNYQQQQRKQQQQQQQPEDEIKQCVGEPSDRAVRRLAKGTLDRFRSLNDVLCCRGAPATNSPVSAASVLPYLCNRGGIYDHGRLKSHTLMVVFGLF
jgi:hypothetical protein